MATDKRYDEKEIAEIFRRAAEEQETAQRNRPPESGLSLAELQKIGKETGITPEFIARAAASLEGSGSSAYIDTLLGFPIFLSRTVELPRVMTDDEWERLVVDLRSTFGGDGTITRDGSLRRWTYGEMFVNVEPYEKDRSRVRITTSPDHKASSKFGLGFGVLTFFMSLVFWVMVFLADGVELNVLLPAIAFLTIAMLPFIGLLRLPAWGKRKEAVIEGIATRLKSSFAVDIPTTKTTKTTEIAAETAVESPQISLEEETPAIQSRNKNNPRLRS